MTGYRRGRINHLIDANGQPIGFVGRDGREWIYPASLSGNADIGSSRTLEGRVLYDATDTPIGFEVNQREFIFANAFLPNTTRGLRTRWHPLLVSPAGVPIGVKAGSTIVPTMFATAPIEGGTGGGGGGTAILDQVLGSVGTGVFAGTTLVAGMDFASATVANTIATQMAPRNKLWPSRGYSGGGGVRAPASGSVLAVMTDPSADYTGWLDYGRGVLQTYDNGAPQSIVSLADASAAGGTRNALRLHACRQSSAEQVFLATGVAGQIERGSMVHTLNSLWWAAPAKVRVRAAIPLGPQGWHPTLWSVQIQNNNFGYNGSEHGWECGGTTKTTAYEDPHNAGNVGLNSGTLDIGDTQRTVAPHDWVIDEGGVATGKLTYYVDGAQVNQLTLAGTSATYATSLPSYAIWSSHIGSISGFETYSAAAWASAGAAGANMDIYGIQVWVPTGGKVYTPQVTIPDVLITPGQVVNFTTPTSLALWGVANATTQQCTAIPTEAEEPGSTNAGWPGSTPGVGMPAWLTPTLNADGSYTFTGTAPARGASTGIGGAVEVAIGYCPSGNACNPANFRIAVAPCFVGATTAAFTNGTTGNYDLYSAFDAGRLGKTLAATGLPPGMTLNASGIITGPPTTTGSYTIAATCTNSLGQATSQNIAVTVSAASAPVPAPTLSTGTIVASWDANDPSKITTASGAVTQITGSDGTSVTVANGAGTGPTLASRVDGNGNTKTALLYHLNQYLKVANGLGITSDYTVIAVVEFVTNNITQAIVDVAAGGGTFAAGSRHTLVASSSSTVGVTYRKIDGSGVASTATTGAYPVAGAGVLHIYIGRSPSGSSAAILDTGKGVNIVGTPVSTAGFTVNTTTLGATTESNAAAKFGEHYAYRYILIKGAISDADVAAAVSWGSTNYGTQTTAEPA